MAFLGMHLGLAARQEPLDDGGGCDRHQEAGDAEGRAGVLVQQVADQRGKPHAGEADPERLRPVDAAALADQQLGGPAGAERHAEESEDQDDRDHS
jgi:hypothetical protein